MSKSPCTILIIDDSQEVLDQVKCIISEVLLPHQVEVISAESGDKALELLKKSSPHLIFVDILLPEGETFGLWILEKIQILHPNASVYAISAFWTDYYKKKSKELGVVDCLEKPLNSKQLQEIVHSQYSKRLL